VNIFVGRRQLDTIHVHSDRNDFTFVRTAIHDFVFDQCVCFGRVLCSCTKCFLSYQTDLHASDFDLDQMETDFSYNHVSQMVKLFVPLEFNVQAFLNTDLHFHWSDGSLLYFVIGLEDCEIEFFGKSCFHVSS
jgi:hypothetical protein